MLRSLVGSEMCIRDRYKHSYYERKAYLGTVAIKDQNVREVSEAIAERMYEERTQVLDEQEREEFETLTSDLHHLKSTSSIPGVFNSPYVEPLKAFGVPMEDHLQNSFKTGKFCHRHLRRALGNEMYTRTYTRFGQSASLASGTSSQRYQHSSMPRPVASYKLQTIQEPIADNA
eukprot:TRINITY_DN11071_c0_g1_i6.p1 TRINITY_DN11071_c0_g1~~TRINITY_DN11071_c0_g1_i6.p1  ORF type:complete len:174 (+),score=28.22 TRINITY_DN11071_c0_g1_i6:118-639(+)